MTSFNQLGDPVCEVCPEPAACLCEHHGAAYAELEASETADSVSTIYDTISNGETLVQVQITITEKCCVVVNAAAAVVAIPGSGGFKIERPLGTDRTTQDDYTKADNLTLTHNAAWEVLDPGTYTYYLVNRSGEDRYVIAAWIKAVASDCEG